MEKHYEIIKCPECSKIQKAIVEHTIPFLTFIHCCKKCKYLIMESEWNKIQKSCKPIVVSEQLPSNFW